MSSSLTMELAEDLIEDFVNYGKVDWRNQIKNVFEIAEDTFKQINRLIGLKELLIDTKVENSSAECMQQRLSKLSQINDDIETLCHRINTLEPIVAMVEKNLSLLEDAIDKVQAEGGVSERLFRALNPL